MTGQTRSVEEASTEAVKPGDTIWAPDDGDWFKVARVHRDKGWSSAFERADGSLAEFGECKTVLVLR